MFKKPFTCEILGFIYIVFPTGKQCFKKLSEITLLLLFYSIHELRELKSSGKIFICTKFLLLIPMYRLFT